MHQKYGLSLDTKIPEGLKKKSQAVGPGTFKVSYIRRWLKWTKNVPCEWYISICPTCRPPLNPWCQNQKGYMILSKCSRPWTWLLHRGYSCFQAEPTTKVFVTWFAPVLVSIHFQRVFTSTSTHETYETSRHGHL